MQLNKIQAEFKDVLFEEPKDFNGDFAALFKTDGASLSERMAIYRNNVLKSLTDVIIDVFPTVEKLTGDDFARGMARKFVKAHPPEKGNLNDYGATYPDFIDNFEPAKKLAYLPDVARMDWACHAADYAADDETLNPEALKTVKEEDFDHLIFQFRDSVSLLESPYPLVEIREFCQNDDPDQTLNIDQGGSKLLIYRPELKVTIVKLGSTDYNFLRLIQKGTPLTESAETISFLDKNLDLGTTLQKFFTWGIFRSFEIRK